MLLLAVILIGMAAGIYGAVKKIDYAWRWYRVPQYFAYKGEDAIKTPFDGRVEAIAKNGATTAVTVVSEDNSEKEVLNVDTDSLRVTENEDLFQGDTVGFVGEWRLGPLMHGLWTTMWLSGISSVLALFIGLLTGLCRISNNFTLRGMAAITSSGCT